MMSIMYSPSGPLPLKQYSKINTANRKHIMAKIIRESSVLFIRNLDGLFMVHYGVLKSPWRGCGIQ